MKTESSTASDASGAAEARVLEILDAYLAEQRAGRAPDRAALLAKYPDLAESLAASLRALDFVHGAGRSLDGPAAPPSGEEPAAPGRQLGDYRILREIARGGMATVYEAEQVSLGRRVALKVLPFAAVLDSRQLQRFKNEAQAAAQIQHPHIVPVYAVGCDRGVHYYAMQYIEGQSLAVAIRELKEGGSGSLHKTPLSSRGSHRTPAYVRMAVTLGVHAARALDHAHQMGIVHRDVKPGNLLVDPGGTLWITDFGLAHSRKDMGLTVTGEILGTIRYMSPEQALARPGSIDHRTDVYSLGATLYELLALEPAFPGEDAAPLLKDIASKDPAPLRRLNPALPRDVETVILKAMSKDPSGRYATAGEMADDLERFLENRPIAAKRPGLVRRAAKWSRRHRTLVGAGTVVLLLAVAGLAIGTGLLWREQTQTRTALARADANFSLALKVLDRIYMEGTDGSPRIREGLDDSLLEEGLRFYERFGEENANNEDIAWLVGEAYTKAGLIYLEMGEEDGAKHALDRAISVCRQAIPHQADPVRTYVSLGNALSVRGDLDEAIRAYEAAIALRPDDGGARINLGIALMTANDLAGAIAAFRKATELMPRDASAQNELGMALLEDDKRGEAIRAFDKAIQLQPDFAPTYTNLGNALRDDGAHDAAFDAYQTAARLQKKSVVAHVNLGLALQRRGELKRAIEEFRTAIECQRSSFIAHWYLGVALGEDGDAAGRAHYIAEAVRLRSQDPMLHLLVPHKLDASVGLTVRAPQPLTGPAPAADGTPIKLTLAGLTDQSKLPDSAVVSVKGTGTPLGDFTLELNLSINMPNSRATGTFAFKMTNGDTLFGTIIGGLMGPKNRKAPTVVLVVETGTIKGGTGRFDGATGSFTIKRLYERKSTVTDGTIEGTISLRQDEGRR